MSHKIARSTFLAQSISKTTNPCILSVVTLILIAILESIKVSEIVSLVVTILLFFVLIPAVYVYMRIPGNGNRIKSVIDLTLILKQHPRDVIVLALLLGLPCALILWFLKAPNLLIFAIVALIASSTVTALFNIFYRVSFHLTAITILIIIAAQAWGQGFLVLLVSIPVIAWAKYYIHDHTVSQLLAGIAVGMVVSLATLYPFSRL